MKRPDSRSVVLSLSSALVLLGACQTGDAFAPRSTDQADLRAFLQSYVDEAPPGRDRSTRFSQATVPGTPLTLVYLSGRNWCGSGGCTLLVLRSRGSGFELLSKVSTVNLPIRSLATMHNGLPDVVARVEGGGVRQGYEAVLTFDGSKYPASPSAGSAMEEPAILGQVLIDRDSRSSALYD